jgi:hypothetical protein
MLEFKTRLVAPSLALLTGIALVGCSASKDGPKWPPAPTNVATAKFNIAAGSIPYPADPFFFAGSTDGTLNLPSIAYRPASNQNALNALDGWSTSGTIDTSFSMPLDAASISGSTVKMIKVWLNPTNKAPVDTTVPAQVAAYMPAGSNPALGPIAGVLAYGTDYKADVSDDTDSEGKILRITPLKPLAASSGPYYNSGLNAGKVLNVGYIVILTNGLKATSGAAMGPDTLYASIKSAPANCSTITNATENLVCQFTKPQLSIAQATGTDPASIVLSWSFSTQSIDDTFAVLAATVTARQTLIVPTGLNTHQVNAGFAGKADVYVGSTVLPYYLTPAANNHDATSVMTKFWTAAGAPNPAFGLDPASRNLTMFNPIPARVADVTVPLLVTIPNASSACPGKPAGGWPVAIVQHGITGNRSQTLTMADAFADACFIVAAIDLPLHGITDTTSPLYCTPAKPQCIGATERTFDLDIMNNTTGKAGPDGLIDPAAGVGGSTYLNLSSPLTGRDNLRQSEVDLTTFTKSVQQLAIAPGTPAPAGPVGVDATRVSFVGLSMGSIVGGAHVHFSNDTRTATLAVPGGVITRMGLDSPTFGPPIIAAVGANLPPNSYLFNLFFRDIQAAIDSGDPINHIKDAQTMHPLHLIKVLNDQVVPNSATDRLIVAAGLTKLKTLGPNAVGPGTGAYTFFKVGSHGSLFDPTTSLAATVEMQKQTVLFAASAVQPGGPFVVLTNPAVLDLN